MAKVIVSFSETKGWKVKLTTKNSSKTQILESDDMLCSYYRPDPIQCQFLDKGIGLSFEESYIIVSPKGISVNLISWEKDDHSVASEADLLSLVINELLYFTWLHPVKLKIMFIPMGEREFRELLEKANEALNCDIREIDLRLVGEWWKIQLPPKYAGCRKLIMKNPQGWNEDNRS